MRALEMRQEEIGMLRESARASNEETGKWKEQSQRYMVEAEEAQEEAARLRQHVAALKAAMEVKASDGSGSNMPTAAQLVSGVEMSLEYVSSPAKPRAANLAPASAADQHKASSSHMAAANDAAAAGTMGGMRGGQCKSRARGTAAVRSMPTQSGSCLASASGPADRPMGGGVGLSGVGLAPPGGRRVASSMGGEPSLMPPTRHPYGPPTSPHASSSTPSLSIISVPPPPAPAGNNGRSSGMVAAPGSSETKQGGGQPVLYRPAPQRRVAVVIPGREQQSVGREIVSRGR